ncbi:type II and III secretion system protein family protein [Novosphingobium profundi]|uniref:type II and III secretion system protein family protein n=1 Tax=Novosphingobium profundi TaxID=1774954 RepID=UPI001BDA79D5|nr:type II and III secretion system protein family protein [Novosphingobium profundi]MBT0669462.1 type II and III secretion system protein family protein [Novosphingobium profundi]
MTRRLLTSLLHATCVAMPSAGLTLGLMASPAGAQTTARPAQDISLSIGNGQLITVPGMMADVFVANDDIADVQVKSTNQLYVFGKAGGTTTVYASDKGGRVIWSANIRVGSNFDSVDAMLRLAMPEAQITVSPLGTSTFLLTGTIKAPEDAAEAERLVQAYVGDKANVISRLRTATPLQVNLQVRIAEVSRSLVKTLGVNLATSDSTSGFKFGIGQGSAVNSMFTPGGPLGVGVTATTGQTDVAASTSGTTLGMAGKLLGVDILGALDAGETVGLVTSLAQPNLTALSGETAEFLAGGEYPIPISQGSSSGNNVTIQYKQYGVSLSYTPTVLANGRISLRVRPEVSELSSEGSVTLNGFEVPALTTRRTETTVELGSGQSFMIAGLLQNNTSNSIQKMPGAGDLPILGSLFRSTSYKRGETELVIVITPYLVKPVDASQIVLPTDGFNSPNELQRILGNQQSDGVDGQRRPGPTRSPDTATVPSVGDASGATLPATGAQTPRTASSDSDIKPGFNLK